MKLIYIWVEEFKNMKQTGFSFTDKFKVKVKSNLEKYDVLIEENNRSVESLLFGENINLVSVVGDNGAGKSTLLDLIRIMLFDQNRIKNRNVGFSIWFQENKLVKYAFCNKHVTINGEAVNNVTDDNEFNLIYYSDTFDIKHYDDDFDDGEDVETYIEEDDWNRYFNDLEDECIVQQLSFQNRYMKQYNVSTTFLLKNSKNDKDKIINFFHDEVKRHIDLYSRIRKISDYENNMLTLKIPDSLTISIKFLSPKICDEVLDDHLVNYSYKDIRDAKHGGNYTESVTIYLLQELLKIYDSVVNKGDYKIISKIDINSLNDIICWNLLIIYIYRILDERKEVWENDKDDYEYVDGKLEGIIEKYNNAKDIFKFCRELFEVVEKGEYEESFKKILDFYECLKDFRIKSGHSIDINFRFSDEIMSILNVSNRFVDVFQQNSLYKNGWNGEKDINDFMNLYSKYEKIVGHLDFFMLDWGMSTGEFSLFSIFARIYSSVSRIQKENGTDIMILLDEIDNTFHPSWQQTIISDIINFLKLLYPEKRFQIIFTTHSPVLLSDIPKQNVIFLKEQAIEEEHEQTFAANIASLYYDSFFMKKGSIGNLAHNCINNLINAMNSVIEDNISDIKIRRRILVNRFYELHHKMFNKDFDSEQYEEKTYQIRNLINSVGEGIWRYKLNELFEQCEVVSEEKNINKEFLEYIEQLKNSKGETAVIKLLEELKEKNK
ncbi:AAA family ATPase [Clostridium sp.]|uniref:AAA family ATPase n=1 Tax=Clostridium sp. TaxID=1506 RepID=UPI0025BCA585|nr:AAA family ATPase [Clostridium sp.]